MIQFALTDDWDIALAPDGNQRLVSDNLELAQSVACNCRVIMGECWLDDMRGVPYSLGNQDTSLSLLTEYLKLEVERDSRVNTMEISDVDTSNRTLSGTILINGESNARF